MDSVGSSGAGYFPQMENIPPHNHDGTGAMHVYVPWWKYDRKMISLAAITSRWAAAATCRVSACFMIFATT